MIKIEIKNKEKKGSFVIYENDEFAGEMTYFLEGKSKMIIDHTSVEAKFGGKGFGKKLVMKSVEYARNKDFKIQPFCPYVKKVFETDESIKDVLC